MRYAATLILMLAVVLVAGCGSGLGIDKGKLESMITENSNRQLIGTSTRATTTTCVQHGSDGYQFACITYFNDDETPVNYEATCDHHGMCVWRPA